MLEQQLVAAVQGPLWEEQLRVQVQVEGMELGRSECIFLPRLLAAARLTERQRGGHALPHMQAMPAPWVWQMKLALEQLPPLGHVPAGGVSAQPYLPSATHCDEQESSR